MHKKNRICKIRKLLQQHDISAIIITNRDSHLGEFVDDNWKPVKWISGFTGLQCSAVITNDQANLWADARYWLQAEKQLDESLWELFRLGQTGVPSPESWLADHLNEGDVVGIDGSAFSVADVRKFENQFYKKKIKLKLKKDFRLVDIEWFEIQTGFFSKAFSFPVIFAGQTRVSKIRKIREILKSVDADFHLIAALDDIAWIFNVRGNDRPHIPVIEAFVLIGRENTVLFVNGNKIRTDLKAELAKDNIEIQPYNNIYKVLSDLEEESTILLDSQTINYNLFTSINKGCNIIDGVNPASGLKAIKNAIEINNIKQTMIQDGVAMVNFLYDLETSIGHEIVTELSLAEKLFKFRSQQDLFISNSFKPIVAYQDHSAICHYAVSEVSNRQVKKEGLLLVDSGGNYYSGTTDITRTILLGKPSKQMIQDYTLILKGHISVATAVFPEGTQGYHIDSLARQHLWKERMDYHHGTGHGIGFFLGVHEGPCCISSRPIGGALSAGMLLSNEPGIYRKKQYGIRIENMILVVHDRRNDFGSFFKFENLTLCHFERKLVDKKLLSAKEINWLNNYHKIVYEKLGIHLEKEMRSWLKEKILTL